MDTSYQFDAIGTQWRIDYDATMSRMDVIRISKRLIEQYDAVYSRFRADSLVADMARSSGIYRLPNHAVDLFSMYRQLYEATNGLVTPLIGGVLAWSGYDAAYSLRRSTEAFRPAPDWDTVMKFDAQTSALTTTQPIDLDVGAAGKGQLIDLLADDLASAGATGVVIDASGDIINRTDQPMQIGLEHPDDPSQVIGTIYLQPGMAICGSAINRRSWGTDQHHIVNPTSGVSPHDIIATWVISSSGLRADALSTALFFISADQLPLREGDDHLVVYSSGSASGSAQFATGLFTATLG